MNEKLEQAKNEIAKEYGYESFEILVRSFNENDLAFPCEIQDKVAERYHSLMSEWIDERIKEVESERQLGLQEYINADEKQRDILAAVNMQMLLEIKCLKSHLPTPPKQ